MNQARRMWKLFLGLAILIGVLPFFPTGKAFAGAPTATIVVADDYLTVGQSSLVTITFSEGFTGFTNANLKAENGTLSPLSSDINSSNYNKVFTCTFMPHDGIADDDNVITLNYSGVTAESNHYSIYTKSPGLTVVANNITVSAGTDLSVTVNVNTDYRGTVRFTSSDPQAVLPPDYKFQASDNGSRTFPVKLNTVGAQTITVTDVNDPNTTVAPPSITVTPSADATLSGLTLSGVPTLSPAFVSGTTEYTASVANSVKSTTVTGTLNNSHATMTIGGNSVNSGTASSAITLNEGSNTITIVVTAQNGTTKTYTVTLTREQPSADATLSGLTLGGMTLSPSFASGTTEYTASVANSVYSTTVTGIANDSNATMTVNGTPVRSGSASGAINLDVGINTITLVVTAENGTTKTYNVAVNRAARVVTSPSDSTVISTNGKLTLAAGRAGKVSLGDEVTILIPAGASSKDLTLTIDKVLNSQNLLKPIDILTSPIYEILKNYQDNFNTPVTITFAFDPASVKTNQKAAVFYYDEANKIWVEVEGGKVNGSSITIEVNHFTKYAVFAVDDAPPADANPDVTLTDIAGHWAESKIKQAVSAGIATGYPDGTFKPNQSVTRAEFVVMLMNALKPQGEATAPTFTDTAKIGSWAQEAVAQAVQAGMIKGYEDGSFRPDAEMTRSEMAVILANALSQTIEAKAATGFTDDRDIPAWAKGSIAYVKEAGIMQGKGDNEFAPQAHATRAEAVTVLLSMLAQMTSK